MMMVVRLLHSFDFPYVIVNYILLLSIMNDYIGFWIAQQVADIKYTHDITPLFSKGKDIADTRSTALISDCAPNSILLLTRSYGQTSGHVQGISITFDFIYPSDKYIKKRNHLKIELFD